MSSSEHTTDSKIDFYEKTKYLLAWRVNIIFTITFGMLTIIFVNRPIEEIIVYFTSFLISVGCLITSYFTKKTKFTYYSTAVFGTIAIFFTVNIFPRSIHAADYSWISLIILFTFFGLGRKIGIITVLFNSLTILYSIVFINEIDVNHYLDNMAEDNTFVGIEVLVSLFLSSYVIYQFITINMYFYTKFKHSNSELRTQNQTINSQNDEKTVLIKEIHHRVKNNLQIIISLLKLQKNEIKSIDTKLQFDEAINRIMTMSLIHEKLYSGDSLSKVNLKEYITDLCNDIATISNKKKSLYFDIQVSIEKIDLDKIISIGLIINELVTNSIKHAFKTKNNAIIRIQFYQNSINQISMVYSDNGLWLKETRNNKGFGLELIETLTEQLDGEYKRIINENGTTFNFQLSD